MSIYLIGDYGKVTGISGTFDFTYRSLGAGSQYPQAGSKRSQDWPAPTLATLKSEQVTVDRLCSAMRGADCLAGLADYVAQQRSETARLASE